LQQFFQNVMPFLRNDMSRIHITHKTIEPFCWWGLESIAQEAGYRHVCSVLFDICCYPGYSNRKALDKKSFPSNDAKVCSRYEVFVVLVFISCMY
jgi:hypothetical protein